MRGTAWSRGPIAARAIPSRPAHRLGPGRDIPTNLLLDDRIFAVTALYAEYQDPLFPLPEHDSSLMRSAMGFVGKRLSRPRCLWRVRRPGRRPSRSRFGYGPMLQCRPLANFDGVVSPVRSKCLAMFSKKARLSSPSWAKVGFPLLLRRRVSIPVNIFFGSKCGRSVLVVPALPGDPCSREFLDRPARTALCANIG